VDINSTTLSLPHGNTKRKTFHLLYEILVFLFVVRCGSDSVVVGFMSTYYMSSWPMPGTHIIGEHKSYYNTITATSQHEQEDQELI
jgi:hypothetical protein